MTADCSSGLHVLCGAPRAAACDCRCHARARFDLGTRCPRLARARRQRIVELAAERHLRRRIRADLLALERLVAHRDLQLLRASATGHVSYIARRERKLAAASRDLARIRAQALRLGIE